MSPVATEGLPSTLAGLKEKAQQVLSNGTSSTATTEATAQAPACWIPGFNPKPNLALFVTADHKIYTKEIPFPELEGDDECIVHVKCTGICGSELHFWKTGGIGDYIVSPDKDLILGHESSGLILAVGKNVKDLKAGDRVSIEPGVSCSACLQCCRGRYNLCPDVKFSGTPPTHGTLRRYVSHKASFLHKIPDTMSYAQAALVEPISVGFGGLLRSGLRIGQPALVCGAGPIGLVAVSLVKAAGAYPIIVTDIAESRLTWAKNLGADGAVCCDMSWDGKRVGEEVKKAFAGFKEGLRPEVALECTGAQSSFYGATYALQDGGVLMQIGNGHNEQAVPFQSLSMREIDVRFLFRYINTWPTIISLLDAKRLPGIEEIITHTFNLEDTIDAFETAADRTKGSVKIQIIDED